MDSGDPTLYDTIENFTSELTKLLVHPSMSEVGVLSVQTVLPALRLLKYLQVPDTIRAPQVAIPDVPPVDEIVNLPFRSEEALLGAQSEGEQVIIPKTVDETLLATTSCGDTWQIPEMCGAFVPRARESLDLSITSAETSHKANNVVADNALPESPTTEAVETPPPAKNDVRFNALPESSAYETIGTPQLPTYPVAIKTFPESAAYEAVETAHQTKNTVTFKALPEVPLDDFQCKEADDTPKPEPEVSPSHRMRQDLKIAVPPREFERQVTPESNYTAASDQSLPDNESHTEPRLLRRNSKSSTTSVSSLRPQAWVDDWHQRHVPDVGSVYPIIRRREEIWELTSSASLDDFSQPGQCFIDPNHPWRICWDLCSMGLILIFVIIVPFETTFLWDDEPTPTTNYVVLWWVNIVGDIFFCIDILLNCFTGYHKGNGANSRLVKNPKQIIRHYARGWLWVDILATFPFARFAELVGSEGTDAAGMLRVLKAVKATRILKVLRALKLRGLMQLLEESMVVARSMAVAFQVFKLGIIILLGTHCAACTWFGVGFFGHSLGYETTWLAQHGIDAASPGRQWVASFYFAVTTGTTVGYGDITATNQFEEMCASILLVSFVAFIGQALATVGQVITAYQMVDAEKKMVKFHAITFMQKRSVPLTLRSKVLRYVEYVYEIDSLTSFSQTGFFEKLSESLQMELRESITGNFLTQFQIFAEADETFVRAICPVCETQRSGKSDIVAQKGDANNAMFMIVRGEVTFGLSGKDMGTLHAKDWFGERALFFDNLQHNVTLRCETDCEFLVLSRISFLEQVAKFPQIEGEYKAVVSRCNSHVEPLSPLSLRKTRRRGPWRQSS